MSKESDKLGANIRSLRRAYGETQEQLAAVLYTEKNTISNYERGDRQPPRKTIIDIANHYMIRRTQRCIRLQNDRARNRFFFLKR